MNIKLFFGILFCMYSCVAIAMKRKLLDDSFVYFVTTEGWRKKHANIEAFKGKYPKRQIDTIKDSESRRSSLLEVGSCKQIKSVSKKNEAYPIRRDRDLLRRKK